MTPLLLSLSLVVAHGTSPSPCTDVYDRTAECTAPDVEGLAVAPEGEAHVDARANEPDPELDSFGWRLLAASGVAGALGVALTGAVVAYDVHLAALRNAGQASTDTVTRALDERAVVGWSAVAAYTGAGLLLATSGAFFLFDPSRGAVREAFVITDE